MKNIAMNSANIK